MDVEYDPIVRTNGTVVPTMAMLHGRLQPRGLQAILADLGQDVRGKTLPQLQELALTLPEFANLQPVLVVSAEHWPIIFCCWAWWLIARPDNGLRPCVCHVRVTLMLLGVLRIRRRLCAAAALASRPSSCPSATAS